MPLSRFLRYAAVAGFLLAAASAQAINYTYNGNTVIRSSTTPRPLIVNTGSVVSPGLQFPSQIQYIIRAQGAITRNNFLLTPGKGKASYTLTVGGVPTVLTGTVTKATAGHSGSTIVFTITPGSNPSGTITFRLQPGAMNALALLTFTAPAHTERQYFVANIQPNISNP